MNREQIQRQSYQCMALIEEVCGGGHVNPWLQAYYRLHHLIAENFESYFASFSLMPIDRDEAEGGKQELGLGNLSLFEEEVIQLLDRRIQEEERRYTNQICLVRN